MKPIDDEEKGIRATGMNKLNIEIDEFKLQQQVYRYKDLNIKEPSPAQPSEYKTHM